MLVVPVDFSPHARAAALRACALAQACDATVRLIHAEAGSEAQATDAAFCPATDAPHAVRSRELESWCSALAERGAAISGVVEQADPVALITRHTNAANVLLVVMGMHGFHGFDRLFLGSVAERALRCATVPIMLVKENEQGAAAAIHRILLATDFSPASEHALRLAIHWARRLAADVEVLHAIPEHEDSTRYARPRDSASRSGHQRAHALESLRSILSRSAAAGVRAVADLTYGVPSVEIVKHAARSRADLVVLGLGDHVRGKSGRTGSVTERVIRHVKCSVLVAPEERAAHSSSSSPS
jgi:nucleotide-binding universal stress UspA family protein